MVRPRLRHEIVMRQQKRGNKRLPRRWSMTSSVLGIDRCPICAKWGKCASIIHRAFQRLHWIYRMHLCIYLFSPFAREVFLPFSSGATLFFGTFLFHISPVRVLFAPLRIVARVRVAIPMARPHTQILFRFASALLYGTGRPNKRWTTRAWRRPHGGDETCQVEKDKRNKKNIYLLHQVYGVNSFLFFLGVSVPVCVFRTFGCKSNGTLTNGTIRDGLPPTSIHWESVTHPVTFIYIYRFSMSNVAASTAIAVAPCVVQNRLPIKIRNGREIVETKNRNQWTLSVLTRITGGRAHFFAAAIYYSTRIKFYCWSTTSRHLFRFACDHHVRVLYIHTSSCAVVFRRIDG